MWENAGIATVVYTQIIFFPFKIYVVFSATEHVPVIQLIWAKFAGTLSLQLQPLALMQIQG